MVMGTGSGGGLAAASGTYLEGGPVTDGMVQGEQQQVVLAAQLDQQCPDQRPLR